MARNSDTVAQRLCITADSSQLAIRVPFRCASPKRRRASSSGTQGNNRGATDQWPALGFNRASVVPKNGRVVYVAAPGRRLYHPERIHRRQQRLASNSVYSATKAAVRSFARTWTTDLRDRRIRVNAVSPGSTDTLGPSELLASPETGQQRLQMISNSVPLGRLGTPDEIAKAVVCLASDDSSYVTWTELFVDGGFAQV